MIRTISKRFQIFRKEFGVIRDIAWSHDIAGGLLRVVAGEQAASGGSAAGGGVALREAESAGGEGVEIRCVDVAAVAAGVGKSHVVGEDDDEVRLPGLRALHRARARGYLL